MSSESWQNLGNFVNSVGITGLAVTGATSAMAAYQKFASPYVSLAESERILKGVRSRLQELSPQRREEIDLDRPPNSKSLKDIEGELDKCVLLIDVSFKLKSMAGSLVSWIRTIE